MIKCRNRVMTGPAVSAAAALLLLLAPAPASAKWGNCPDEAKRLVDKADQITRGNSARGVMRMQVYKRGTVSMKMRFWSKGRDKFLAKILRPSRLRGMATLKSGTNLWNYLPRLDRIVKVGSSMMGSSWMGSHFSNDDLVKETDYRKHYTCDSYQTKGDYIWATLKPKPNAPVVWGKVVSKVQKSGPYLLSSKFYDESGTLKRTMTASNIRSMGGRTLPTRIVMQPADKPSERTVVTYVSMKFNIGIPSRYFTLQGLKR